MFVSISLCCCFCDDWLDITCANTLILGFGFIAGLGGLFNVLVGETSFAVWLTESFNEILKPIGGGLVGTIGGGIIGFSNVLLVLSTLFNFVIFPLLLLAIELLLPLLLLLLLSPIMLISFVEEAIINN